MKYDFKGITPEELSFKLNRVHLPEQGVDIRPQFSRHVTKPNENRKLVFINLSMKIESTEQEPKPFNLTVSVVGMFELGTEDYTAAEERSFVIEATGLLYPYLRTYVSTLMATGGVNPIMLPVLNGPIFPEDRDVFTFQAGNVDVN